MQEKMITGPTVGYDLIGHPVVSNEQWEEAMKAHLVKEKEFMRMNDELTRQRHSLPWRKVEKEYVFDAPEGRVSLADLFNGRSQLIIKHFMLGPEWKEGCVGCSFESDHVDNLVVHLENHDVSYVAVSRAPLQQLQDFHKRMGWHFKWVSSNTNDFNFDFHVSFTDEQVKDGKVYYNFDWRPFQMDEMSGLSIFYKDEKGDIYHTYSVFGRGGELTLGAYRYLDITPRGRNEMGPNRTLTDWVRHHDKYGAGGHVDSTGRYHAEKNNGTCCH